MQIDHHSNQVDGAPVWKQDSRHKIASRGGQLGMTRPAGEDN